MRRLLVPCLLIWAVAMPARALAAGPWLPMELSELATEAGCRPIQEFFERPAMVEPPYLYGYVPGKGRLPEAEQARGAVFWCRNGAGESSGNVLVFARKAGSFHGFSLAESQRLLACPPVLPWPTSRGNPPGGLSVGTAQDEPLDGFRYADDLEHRGPPDRRTTHPPLRSRYDGTGWDFYCHAGKWLVRGID